MPSPLTDRNHFVAQQLFEVEIRLERARHALDIAEEHLGQLRAAERTATERLGASPTPLADQECCVARERVAQMNASTSGARRLVSDLELRKDDLLSKLVG